MAAAQQELGRVDRRAIVFRHQLGGAQGMRNRAVQIAGGGQRAAQMAMALGPIGRKRQQPLVSRRGLLMTTAIAEQPAVYLVLLQLSRRRSECINAMSARSGVRFNELFRPASK